MAGALTRPRPAFTLLELIGVLAIMAVLAAAVAPSALRSLDRAAVSAESQTVTGLGSNLTTYLRKNGVLPSAAGWATAIAPYAGLASAEITTNRRGMNRVYLADPAASPAPRAVILSSLRRGLTLPAASAITTAAEFDAIWQTADGSVPPASSWSGWSNWASVANAGDYLVIGRINLASIYATDLQTFTVTLNNRGSAAGSYARVLPNGTAVPAVNVAAGASAVLAGQTLGTRLDLYRGAGATGLAYSYVVSSGKTFDFDGTNWNPQ